MSYTKITQRDHLNAVEVRAITTLLRGARANSQAPIDENAVGEHLNDMLAQLGLISPESNTEEREDEFDQSFTIQQRQPIAERDLQDSFKELAKQISAVERKLGNPDLSPALASRARYLLARRPNRALKTENELSGAKLLKDVRLGLGVLKQSASDLATYHTTNIKTGRPRQELLDVLMTELAFVYQIFRPGYEGAHKLPISPKSIFIRFCTYVISLFSETGQVEIEALSYRWKRLRLELRDDETS